MGSGRDPSGLEETAADPNAATLDGGTPAAGSQRPLGRGASLGRYLVVDRLGSGGMGVVYSAYDPELDRKLAIKLLRAEASEGDGGTGGRTRLQREAQAMARLSHPNVIAVYDVGTIDDQVFVAMELVHGRTLREWLAAEPRTWERVLEMYVQAGRGLAAAHAAGLVHRDFKPDNVLVGDDGRVRVLDFGLARAVGAAEPARAPQRPVPLRFVERSALATPLTRTGSVLGTPRYMSPEQWREQTAGAPADQFSFCVALYEAWFGKPPFAGGSLPELQEAVLGGKLEPAPADSPVPAPLRDAVLRGLALEPSERHASMEALLAALAHHPQSRRRRWWIAGAAIAAVAAGGGYVALGRTQAAVAPADVCGGARGQLAGVWDTLRKPLVHAAFAATNVPYAADAWRDVERTLDAYADRWVAMHGEACRATRVRGEQSGELLDLRMACLARRRSELAAQVDVFTAADAQTVLHAVDAARALGGLELCADASALKATTPLPADADVRRRIEEARAQITRAEALERAGHYPEAVKIARAAASSAKALDHPPLTAEALYELGDLQNRAGDPNAADATLHAAVLAAEAANDRRLEARTWTSLVFVANQLSRFDDGARDGEHARALLTGPGTELDRSALLVELGNLADSQGRAEDALALYRDALAIREKLLGPEDPHVAAVLDNMGLALVSLGRFDEALEHHQRALAIGEKTLGHEHPDVAGSLSNIGIVLHLMKRDEEAIAQHKRALAILERVLGPNHRDVASTLCYIADCEAALDRAADALATYQRALAIEQAALGPDHRNLAYELIGIGEAELALHHAPAAASDFERALALRVAHPGPPSELAEARFAVARALWQTGGDRKRARTLAEQARADYADDPGEKAALAQVERWLAAHPR